MKLKKLLAGAAFALAATSASAASIPLTSVAGQLDIKLMGLTTETRLTAGSNESTWGIGAITSIDATGLGTWSAGASDGYYLYYMLYGVADLSSTAGGSYGNNLYNIGCTGGACDGKIHLDVYRSTIDLTTISNTKSANPNGRTGFDTYNLFAGMEKFLAVEFVSGLYADDPTTPQNEATATMFQNVSDLTLGAGDISGQGNFAGNVVGGTQAAKWQTGQVGGNDLDGIFTLRSNGPSGTPPFNIQTGTCTDAQITAGVCFAGYINDPVRAFVIPEPGSLAIFGLGLAGLAVLRRRKQQ